MTKASSEKRVKTFVLDTNVIIHDPNCFIKLGEDNNIIIPFTVMEELDRQKEGNRTISADARAASRTLRTAVDKFISDGGTIDDGIPLNLIAETTARLGKLYFEKVDSTVLTMNKEELVNDNLIIRAADNAMKDPRFVNTKVVLLSKDNNVSVKCAILNIHCEDYKNDRVESQYDALHATAHSIDESLWKKYGAKIKVNKENTVYTLPLGKLTVYKNEFVTANNGTSVLNGIVRSVDLEKKTFTFEILYDYKNKNSVYGIHAKDDRQNYVLNALLNPNIDIVTITGNAGSGKTLLTLAAGFNSVINERGHAEIIATRAFIPLGDGIGFLPGDEDAKVIPWMGAFTDNIDYMESVLDPTKKGKLSDNFRETNQKNGKKRDDKQDESKAVSCTSSKELMLSAIKFKTIDFMRGRTFHNKVFVIDEAQNLTPTQIKALVSRSGQGTKVIILGNTNQIDNPYLTPESSGLTYFIHRFRGQENFAHMHLLGVERSKVAEQADRLL